MRKTTSNIEHRGKILRIALGITLLAMVTIVLAPEVSAVGPPFILINGFSYVTVIVGESYSDFGASAYDANFNDVVVITTGSVDTSVIGTYIITYTATDMSGNINTATRTVNVVAAKDTTPPVIELNGLNPVSITIGTSYIDAGATAVDAVEPFVLLVTTGSVDTSLVGTYTITYTATDRNGNIAIATRIVNVVAGSCEEKNKHGEREKAGQKPMKKCKQN